MGCVKKSGKENISSHNLVSGTDTVKSTPAAAKKDTALRCPMPVTRCTDTTLSLGTDSATNHFVPSLQPKKVQRTVRQSGKANASSHNLVNGHSIDTVKPSASRRAEL